MKIKIYNFFLIIRDIIMPYLICFCYIRINYYYYFNKDNRGTFTSFDLHDTEAQTHMDRINFYGFEFIDRIYY